MVVSSQKFMKGFSRNSRKNREGTGMTDIYPHSGILLCRSQEPVSKS